jgi:hypothetical protein
MKKILFILCGVFALGLNTTFAQHNAGNNGKVLMIASNPSVSKQTGWPIGVWYAELTHPYWVFSENLMVLATQKMLVNMPLSIIFLWVLKKMKSKWH